MRQLLSTVLAAQWAGVFGLLAFLCAEDPRSGVGAAFRAFGLGAEHAGTGGAAAAALLGLSFALAASLFLWMLAESLFGRGGDGASRADRFAFTGAVLALLVFLALGSAADPSGGVLVVVECMVAGAAASYLAVCAERLLHGRRQPELDESGDAAREMALGAAHQSLLSSLSGRFGKAPVGRR